MEHQSLVDIIVDTLRRRIIQGNYDPGQRLNPGLLAEEFGTSRTPLREAFRILEQEGLLVIKPRREVIVAPIERKTVLDLYECRISLEALCARLATERRESRHVEAAHRLMARIEQAYSDGDVEGYFSATLEFHQLLADAAQNCVLKQLLQALGRRTLRLRYLATTLRFPYSYADHREIYECFCKQLPEEAEASMRKLMSGGRDAILKYLSDGQAVPRLPELKSLTDMGRWPTAL